MGLDHGPLFPTADNVAILTWGWRQGIDSERDTDVGDGSVLGAARVSEGQVKRGTGVFGRKEETGEETKINADNMDNPCLQGQETTTN